MGRDISCLQADKSQKVASQRELGTTEMHDLGSPGSDWEATAGLAPSQPAPRGVQAPAVPWGDVLRGHKS